MTIKIERVQFQYRCDRASAPLKEFVDTLKKLEIGQSFLYERFSAYHRNALSVFHYITDKRFITRAEGKSRRILRVE